MTDTKSFSLQDQIKKRKTQEMLRSIEAHKVARATGTLPAVPAAEVKSPAPTSSPAKALSATGTLTQPRARVQETQRQNSDPRRTTQMTAIPSAARQTQQAKAVSSSTTSRAR